MRASSVLLCCFLLFPVTCLAEKHRSVWSGSLSPAQSASINYRQFLSNSTLFISSFDYGKNKDDNAYNNNNDTFTSNQTFTGFGIGIRQYPSKNLTHLFTQIQLTFTRFKNYVTSNLLRTRSLDQLTKRHDLSALATFGSEYPLSDAWFIEASIGILAYRYSSDTNRVDASTHNLDSTDASKGWRIGSTSQLDFVYYF